MLTVDGGSDHVEPARELLLPRGAFFVGSPLRRKGWDGVSGEGGGLRSRGSSDYYPVLAPFRVEH